MKDNNTLLNVILCVTLQIITIISGMILPKIILENFGSELNGLASSINQFLNYISLVEGGLGSVFLAALYKPLANNDNNKLSRVVIAGKRYFISISILLVIYTFVLLIIYPRFIVSSFDSNYIRLLIVILSLNLFSQYCFSLYSKLLLQASGRISSVVIPQIISITINIVVTYIAIKFTNNFHIIKLISCFSFVIQPIAYKIMINKYFSINENLKVNIKEELPQRWTCFGINLSAFVINNLDVVLITLLEGLNSVSIYSVYYMVVGGLKTLVMSISQIFSSRIGISIASSNIDEMNRKLDEYEVISFLITTIFFGCCLVLLPSFVHLYTIDIKDIDYYNPLFSALITLSCYLYCIRHPYKTTIDSAGRFKETSAIAYIEVIVNIFLSLLLTIKYSIIGVAIGSCVSIFLRLIYFINYLNKNVTFRKKKYFYLRFFISIAAIILSCFIISNININSFDSSMNWIKLGVISFIIYMFIYMLLVYIFDKDSLYVLKGLLMRNKLN